MTVPNPTTMPTEFTHPFEVPASLDDLADTHLLASIKGLEAELGNFRAGGFDFRDWEKWIQIRLKVWSLLKCQQELCRRRDLEFARTIHVPYLPTSHGLWLEQVGVAGWRICYHSDRHCPEPWPFDATAYLVEIPKRPAWIQFHEVLFFRAVDQHVRSERGYLRAGDETVTAMFQERAGEAWGRALSAGFCFLFEIENSRLARSFHYLHWQEIRHWRIDLLDEVIEVVAGGVEIPDKVRRS